MKKITAFAFAVIMALGMASCGEKEMTPEEQVYLIKRANGNAKSCYNEIAEYIADLEVDDKLSAADEQEAADRAAEYLKANNISGTVGVSFDDPDNITVDSDGFNLNITVQFRFNDAETIVGQYPDPTSSVDAIPEWSANAESSNELK